jgi:PAS domain S-box-containing protein
MASAALIGRNGVLELDDGDPVEDAVGLGLSVLAQIVEQSADGIALTDAQRRAVYVNPALSQMLGRSPGQLLGSDLVDTILPQRARQPARENYPARLTDATDLVTNVLIDNRGAELETLTAAQPVELDGSPHVGWVFRDLSASRTAARAAAALAQSAAELVGTASTDEILSGISRHAVENTRAMAAGIIIAGADDTLVFGGRYGMSGPTTAGPEWDAIRPLPASELLAAISGGTINVGKPAGRAVVVPDARHTWQRNPRLRKWADAIPDQDWSTFVLLPVAWNNQVIGGFGCFLPTGVAAQSEPELAFCSALADHAAVAVANGRLSRQATSSAALAARNQLTRDLHDSVSQALFSITMHARAAQLATDSAGLPPDTPLGRSVTQLSQLARGTLAEMRALIFELRPEALAENGLVGALTTQAAAISAREQVTVEVHSSEDRFALDPDVEQHLYRIVCEALNNVVKHSGATNATVTIGLLEQALRITVTDDGLGFDPSSRRAGHLGLLTMTQRAEAIGATFEIASRPGTTISLRVSLEVHSPRATT